MSAVDGRAEFARGLRELAGFIEAHPDLPVPTCADLSPHVSGTDEEGRAEVDRIAAILGESAALKHGSHYEVVRWFGPVAYRATAIPAEVMARYDATMSYSDVVEPAQGGAR